MKLKVNSYWTKNKNLLSQTRKRKAIHILKWMDAEQNQLCLHKWNCCKKKLKKRKTNSKWFLSRRKKVQVKHKIYSVKRVAKREWDRIFTYVYPNVQKSFQTRKTIQSCFSFSFPFMNWAHATWALFAPFFYHMLAIILTTKQKRTHTQIINNSNIKKIVTRNCSLPSFRINNNNKKEVLNSIDHRIVFCLRGADSSCWITFI